MRSVLRSVKPYWIYCILEGLKKIEVGKDFPKADDWDRTVFLYCSKDRKSLNRIPVEYRAKYERLMGKVVCEFFCNNIIKADCGAYAQIEIDKCCLDISELLDYADGKTIYGWGISELKIYDKPKELNEFFRPCPIMDGDYGDCGNCDYCLWNEYSRYCTNNLTRPPQSWCYVSEVQ